MNSNTQIYYNNSLFKIRVINTLNQHLSNLQTIYQFSIFLDQRDNQKIVDTLTILSNGIIKVEEYDNILTDHPGNIMGGYGFHTGCTLINTYLANESTYYDNGNKLYLELLDVTQNKIKVLQNELIAHL
jgi:hypothetical protein